MDPDGTRDGRDRASIRVESASDHCARRPLLPVIELECAVVRYRDRADRCTIFPPAAGEAERLTTWLSADADALCSLEAWR